MPRSEEYSDCGSTWELLFWSTALPTAASEPPVQVNKADSGFRSYEDSSDSPALFSGAPVGLESVCHGARTAGVGHENFTSH